MLNNPEKFIQTNSPDGGFLQSPEWREFQEKVGHKTYIITPPSRVRDTSPEYMGGGNAPSPVRSTGHPLPSTGEEEIFFHANIIEHSLPVVGKYFYVPRGPVVQATRLPARQAKYKIQDTNKSQNSNLKIQNGMVELIVLAEKNKIGWVRIEPVREEVLEMIKNIVGTDLVSVLNEQTNRSGRTQGPPLRKYKITKAPHDMQPKEVFIIDIAKAEEDILAEMKSKTRYNIRLAEKKGVKVFASQEEKYVEEFLRLVKVTAKRDGIVSHPESYYRKMLEIIPSEILKLYVAEYEGKVIAANLVLFYGETCTYMHGASDDVARNVMAPYLLQWQQIRDAKENGCTGYDFGGVRIVKSSKVKVKSDGNSWNGITRFKMGFSPKTASTIFPGSYDVIIDPKKYYLYRLIQKIKALAK